MSLTIQEENESKVMYLVSDVLYCAKGFYHIDINDETSVIEQRNDFVVKLTDLKNHAYIICGPVVTDIISAALIYYVDEVVYEKLGFKKWHLLQEELLSCNDGGQHFFDLCQQVIDNPSISIVTYKTLYMVLANKFRGIYFDDINQRNLIKQKLMYHIERNDIWIDSDNRDLTDPILHINKSKWFNRLSNKYFTRVAIGLGGLVLFSYVTIFLLL